MRSALRRLPAAATVCAALSLIVAPAAGAHSAFLGSRPAPGQRLAQAPQRIELHFTEPLNARLSWIHIVDSKSRREVAADVAQHGSRVVVRPRRELATGAYEVRWHSVSSDDGHPLDGVFSFGVRAATSGAAHVTGQSPLAGVRWLGALLRWSLYVGLLLLTAVLFLRVLLGSSWLTPRGLRPVIDGDVLAAVRRREHVLGAELGIVVAGLGAASALVDATDAGGSLTPSVLRDYLLAVGTGQARIGVVIFALAAGFTQRMAPRVAAIAGALALLCVSLSGHAIAATAAPAAVALDTAHLIAGSAWLGGLSVLVVAWGPSMRALSATQRRLVARDVLGRFGRVAKWAFALVALTGLEGLLLELGSPLRLATTAYGRVLAVKIAAVGALVGISYLHAIRWRPLLLAANPHPRPALDRRHWRAWRLEPLVGIAVLGAAALLLSFPLPPRQLDSAIGGVRSLTPTCSPCPLPRPRASELAVASHAGSDTVAAWLRDDGGSLSGVIRLLDLRGKPVDRTVTLTATRRARCGIGCVRFAGAPPPLSLSVLSAGRAWPVRLPSAWAPRRTGDARLLLARVERSMRGLAGVRQVETETSGPGSFARTDYVLSAPDRMRYRTNSGAESVVIGGRQWQRAPGLPWTKGSYGAGVPFATRSWFRWTPYATAIRWLGARTVAGHRVVELALMDPGTPFWTRLDIERDTGLVLAETSVTPGHYIDDRYTAFGERRAIRPPGEAGR